MHTSEHQKEEPVLSETATATSLNTATAAIIVDCNAHSPTPAAKNMAPAVAIEVPSVTIMDCDSHLYGPKKDTLPAALAVYEVTAVVAPSADELQSVEFIDCHPPASVVRDMQAQCKGRIVTVASLAPNANKVFVRGIILPAAMLLFSPIALVTLTISAGFGLRRKHIMEHSYIVVTTCEVMWYYCVPDQPSTRKTDIVGYDELRYAKVSHGFMMRPFRKIGFVTKDQERKYARDGREKTGAGKKFNGGTKEQMALIAARVARCKQEYDERMAA